MEVLFLVVTMTGTAEMLAEDVIEAHQAGNALRLQLAERTEAAQLDQVTNLVVISSTYGTGEVPDPGKPLFESLAGKDLSRIRYGVISLGDSVYPNTFARGGLQWDERLEQCGATRLVEPLLLDASSDENMSDLAVAWSAGWLETARAAQAAANASSNSSTG
ncbi:MAG: flavodoxin family protein [Paucimonas sp.]|nr:flavodoxin family protein [Paucimonas sp.]